MQRKFAYDNSYGIPFEFNDNDTVGHPWGDFCMNFSEKGDLNLKINGQDICLPNGARAWVFFHRDSDGKIDHIFPVSFDDMKTIHPSKHLDGCPLCSEEDTPNV